MKNEKHPSMLSNEELVNAFAKAQDSATFFGTDPSTDAKFLSLRHELLTRLDNSKQTKD